MCRAFREGNDEIRREMGEVIADRATVLLLRAAAGFATVEAHVGAPP